MPTEESRFRRAAGRFGTFLESVIIFLLLISGVGFIFLNKIAGQMIPVMPSILVSIIVEVIALVIVSLYAYVRFLRERISETV